MLRYIATILRLFRPFILTSSIKGLSYIDLFFICWYHQVVSDRDILLWITKWFTYFLLFLNSWNETQSWRINVTPHFICMSAFPVCMSALHVCVIWGHPEGNGSLGTGVTNSCESPYVCTMNWTEVLWRAEVLLTSEPFFKPNFGFLKKIIFVHRCP